MFGEGQLNEADNLSDAALTSADFPRAEIVEGLADIKKIYYRI
ncbi:DUF6483 family protein [Acetobacterium sp. KB-1]|jgi:hypothetical protein|nr:DUF6483 family protein [Acetobacterium sp. KB-1]